MSDVTEPQKNSIDAETRFAELSAAVERLYYAAHWAPDRACEAGALWRDVRDKAGLPVGQTLARLGEPRFDATPPEEGMDMLAAFDETISLAQARGMVEPREGLSLAHLRDMRTRIAPSFSRSKLGRWLGWAQCAVVASGVATLEEMKEINKRHADAKAS